MGSKVGTQPNNDQTPKKQSYCHVVVFTVDRPYWTTLNVSIIYYYNLTTAMYLEWTCGISSFSQFLCINVFQLCLHLSNLIFHSFKLCLWHLNPNYQQKQRNLLIWRQIWSLRFLFSIFVCNWSQHFKSKITISFYFVNYCWRQLVFNSVFQVQIAETIVISTHSSLSRDRKNTIIII